VSLARTWITASGTDDLERFVYLDTLGHNPGPGSQNTVNLGFVLLDSAVTENTCSRSDVAGGCAI